MESRTTMQSHEPGKRLRGTARLVVLATVLALALTGCEALLSALAEGAGGLTATQRVRAFIEDVQARPQDITAIDDHFHPESTTYEVIDEQWWDGTVFDESLGPFEFGSLTAGGENPEYPGSVTVTTSYTTPNILTPADVEFTLLPVDTTDDWKIREIYAGESDTYRSIR